MPTRIGPFLTEFNDVYEVAREYSNDPDKPYGEFDKWTHSGPDYNRILSDLTNATVYIAWYGHGSYEGSSYVLWEKDNQLFENYGSHCSCNGLEGQWQPEATTWKAVGRRSLNDGCDGAGQASELLKYLVETHVEF